MRFFYLYDYLLYPSEDPDRVSVLGEGLKCTYVKTREDMVNHGEIKDSIFLNIRRRQPVSKGLSKKSMRALMIDYSTGRLQKEERDLSFIPFFYIKSASEVASFP
jgi:hypothetical protein